MYRLTLVKEWNTDELEAYAGLVSKGVPDFIEIKVISKTYLVACKSSDTHSSMSYLLSFAGSDLLW